MTIKVLVVEDSEDTGSLVTKYLRDHLPRLADPGLAGPSDIARDHDGFPFVGSGQLAHFLPPSWTPLTEADFQIALVDSSSLESLRSAAAVSARAVRKAFAEISGRYFGTGTTVPDVLVVDLALSTFEATALSAQGGNDLPEERIAEGLHVRDARPELELTTGFQLLQQYGEEIPVIATSYARSPLVAQHCVINGAFAVVKKPVVEAKSKNAEGSNWSPGYDMDTAAAMSIQRLESEANDNISDLSVSMVHYLRGVAAEVLKALNAVSVRRADAYVPPDFSRYLLVSADDVGPRFQPNTGLVHVRVPWYGSLVAACRQAPGLLFSLCSEVWSAVDAVLSESDAYFHYVVGGSALAMHRVYPPEPASCGPDALASSAVRISELFRIGGSARQRLLDIMNGPMARDATMGRPERAKLSRLVSEGGLGLHVVAACVPVPDGMYGRLLAGRHSHFTTVGPGAEWIRGVDVAIGALVAPSEDQQNWSDSLPSAFVVVEMGSEGLGSNQVTVELIAEGPQWPGVSLAWASEEGIEIYSAKLSSDR